MKYKEIPDTIAEIKQVEIEFESIEWGCSFPINFITSNGIKRLEPGKSYDENLDEIK